MIVARVAEVTVSLVTVKVAEVAFAGTVTLVGTTAAALLLESETITPPLRAADVRFTVPVAVVAGPSTIEVGLIETLLSAGTTVAGLMVSVNVLLTLVSEAVSITGVEVVTLPPLTVKVADVIPCAIATLAGTVTGEPAGLESQTVKPLVPTAGAVDVTVPVAFPPLVIVLGLTEKVLRAGGGFTVIGKVTLAPEKVAVKVTGVAAVTVPGVNEKVCVVEPCPTVTEVGTGAAIMLVLESVTTSPEEAVAAPVSVTVAVTD